MVYAFCTEWPGSELILQKVKAKEGAQITMYGHGEKLSWVNDPARGLIINLPEKFQAEELRPCLHAWGFNIPTIN